MSEAREAADRIIKIYDTAYRDDIPVVRAEREAILAVHAAGVSEGIRQAREVFEDYCSDFTVGDWDALEARFAAIDATGRTDESA